MYHVLHGANLMSKQTELAQVADTITVDSGNVGIGTDSPSAVSTYKVVQVTGGTTTTGGLLRLETSNASHVGRVYVDSSGTVLEATTATDPMLFRTNNSEAMRIDSSGNLLVGTTSTTLAGNAGFTYQGGITTTSNNGSLSAIMNRNTSYGDIVQFRKDNSAEGGISAQGSGMVFYSSSIYTGIGGSATNPYYWFYNGAIYPTVDNSRDLGTVGNRFDDVYATNGTIQTSDRNEKQDIEELSDAEQRVAVAAKGLMRKFRWRDAVEAKGDEARTHFGIIAQDLQAAFAAEGLDAGDYAMFISTTWWETQTEVPAVEAVAEVLDEDGNVVTEAVEAKDAYTRTDTYDTQEEAPEGATERTRLGVRYSELLAFIIGAL
jgi:hypothetical protein